MAGLFHRFDTFEEAEAYAKANPGTIFRDKRKVEMSYQETELGSWWQYRNKKGNEWRSCGGGNPRCLPLTTEAKQLARDPRPSNLEVRQAEALRTIAKAASPTLEERIRAVVPVETGVIGNVGDSLAWAVFYYGDWHLGARCVWADGRSDPRPGATIIPDIDHPATQGVMMAKILEVYPRSYVYDNDGDWVLVLVGSATELCYAFTRGEALLKGLEKAACKCKC